jgi:hypothetical protein
MGRLPQDAAAKPAADDRIYPEVIDEKIRKQVQNPCIFEPALKEELGAEEIDQTDPERV